MRPRVAILFALCATAATACAPGGWPLDAAPDAASAGSDAASSESDADAVCPPTSCDWMTGDLGGTYFSMCGDGGTVGDACCGPFFWLTGDQGTLVVWMSSGFDTLLPAGMHDASELVQFVELTSIEGRITSSDIMGVVTIADTFGRIELTAYFEAGAITGCIDGDPFW